MIEAVIKNIRLNKNTHKGSFSTMEELNVWKNKCIENDSWGKKERTVRARTDEGTYFEEVYEDEDVIGTPFIQKIQIGYETYKNGKLKKDSEGNEIPLFKEIKFVKLRQQYEITIIDRRQETLKDQLIAKINENVERKITKEFYSNVTGKRLLYDSELTDQFEISQIMASGVDWTLKVTDPISGRKYREPHTALQIKNLYNEFFTFIGNIKMNGDSKKTFLRDNFKTMKITELENFDVSTL